MIMKTQKKGKGGREEGERKLRNQSEATRFHGIFSYPSPIRLSPVGFRAATLPPGRRAFVRRKGREEKKEWQGRYAIAGHGSNVLIGCWPASLLRDGYFVVHLIVYGKEKRA